MSKAAPKRVAGGMSYSITPPYHVIELSRQPHTLAVTLLTHLHTDDLDSPMQDTSTSPTSSTPTTPPAATTTSLFGSDAQLSPPDSQNLQPVNLPSAPSPFTPLSGRGAPASKKNMPPSEQINANGKRIWDTATTEKSGVEKETGYKWEREEDAPGYAWLNPKAREEAARASTQVVERERRVGNRYGDVLLK